MSIAAHPTGAIDEVKILCYIYSKIIVYYKYSGIQKSPKKASET